MPVSRPVEIAAPRQLVRNIVSGIQGAPSRITGIMKIEIRESATGPSLVGLKWRETRRWMGRDATEVMWITEVSEPRRYATRAERDGAAYSSTVSVESTNGGARLTMGLSSEATTTRSKVLWALTGWMAKGALRKVIDQDLADIKAAAERQA